MECLWSFTSSRLGLMKALFVTAARYYDWQTFWTLHTHQKSFKIWKLHWRLHLQWKHWKNLKGMHHIRHRKFRWVTHLIKIRILQLKFQELPKYQKQRIILIEASVRFVKCKYGEVILLTLFGSWLKKIDFPIMKLIYNGLKKKTCLKINKQTLLM